MRAEPPLVTGGPDALSAPSSALSAEAAIPYLLERGLLSWRDVMRGDVHVEDASRRNRNLKVLSSRGSSFVLKQPDGSDPSTLEGIRREAEFYREFASGTGAPMRRLLPQFRHYDDVRSVLVIELIPSTTPLGRFFDHEGGARQPEIAGAAGRAVAAYQRFQTHAQTPTKQRPETPWALRFTCPGPEMLRIASGGQLEVVRLVQQNADAWNVLRATHREYRGDCLVHGDLRWDNILMRRHSRRPGARLWIIDWELAHIGDPAWDVGSAFSAFLARCVAYMEPGTEISSHSLQTAFVNQLPDAQAEIRSFWESYLTVASDATIDHEAFLKRVALFCGARLLQTAFEWSPGQTVSPIAACFLQLGLNLLRRPADAPRVLFRIA